MSRRYDTGSYVPKNIGSDDPFFPNSRTMGQLVKSGIRLARKEVFSTKHRIILWNSFGTQHSGDQKYKFVQNQSKV